MSRPASVRPTCCERCGEALGEGSMSFFNEDVCCRRCLADEREAPGYRDDNFDEGLSARDRAFLAARLRARRALGSDSAALVRAVAELAGAAAAGAPARPPLAVPRLFRGES